MKQPTAATLARCTLQVSRACRGPFARRHAPWQVHEAARVIACNVDVDALRLCIDYLLYRGQWKVGMTRGILAAVHLDDFYLVARHRAEIERRLRAA